MVAITLSLLALKIDIVLDININSYSSTDRWVGISDFKTFRTFTIKVTFHFKISWTATLQFKESRKKERKVRWTHSKERERLEENECQMKRQLEVIRELKNARGLLLINFKNYPHLRCYNFSLTYMSLLVFACFGQLQPFL